MLHNFVCVKIVIPMVVFHDLFLQIEVNECVLWE